MKQRCNHAIGVISEFGTSVTSHFFDNGVLDYHNSDFGDYTGACMATCSECGKEVYFNRHSNRVPRWVKEGFDILEREQPEPLAGGGK